jgi:hypothetical protein
MITEKTAEQVRLYNNLRRMMAPKQSPQVERGSFVRMLAQALDRMESRKSLQRRPQMFTEDVVSIEAAKQCPVQFSPEGDLKFEKGLEMVFKHEGEKYVSRDGGEESSRYGILQSTAKLYGYGGNVKNLSKADARTIYSRIWNESGAQNLPYPLSTVHFDTYVNSPAAARKLLKQSGGDVDTYLRQRGQRYARLAQLRPARFSKYLKGWMNRVASLRNMTAEHRKLQNFAAREVTRFVGTYPEIA